MNSPIINYSYPSTLSVSYKNDFEYRAFIRKLFEMANVSLISITEGLDPVSIDENQYDADAAQKMLDFIYAKTKDDARFQRIYLHAAGFMLSTDEEIGLVVLFSYDYLMIFHPCLCAFFKDPNNIQREFAALGEKIGI